MSACVFCAKIACEDYEGRQGDVVWFPPRSGGATRGHRLYVPVKHVATATADPVVSAMVMLIAAGNESESGDGNFIWNVGPSATQTVFHAHLHWVPRKAGDGLRLPWTKPAVVPSPIPHAAELLSGFAKGLSTAEMAEAMHMAPGSVANAISRLCKEMGVRDRASAVYEGTRRGWLV